MRITGTLTTTGTFHICENYPQEFHDDLHIESTAGIFITADDETLRAASNLLCATVDIYPHPVNGLVAGECTPENYAHALARLAHAEEVSPTADHLAREVRSSQALAAALEKLQADHDALAGIAHNMRIKLVEAESLAAGVRREAAAWLRSLDAPPYFYGLSYETIARCIESGLDPKVIARETA